MFFSNNFSQEEEVDFYSPHDDQTPLGLGETPEEEQQQQEEGLPGHISGVDDLLGDPDGFDVVKGFMARLEAWATKQIN